jgi:ribosome-associated protein YbcJ (S4-like RNA binding protein)
VTLSNEIDTKLRLIEATVAFDDEIEQRWSADLDEAAEKIIELEELIRWLAIPYNGAEPIFAKGNWDGTVIESGARMEKTWRRVVGPGPSTPGAFARCPGCGVYSVQSVLVEGDQ